MVRRRVLFWGIGALSVLATMGAGSALGASTGAGFQGIQESCFPDVTDAGQPVCRDFVDQVTLEPVDGGMRVSWTPGAEDFVKWVSCGPGGRLGDCHITGQSVVSTFDPVTGTGGRECTAPSLQDRSCVVPGLRNGVQYAFRIVSRIEGGVDARESLYSPFTEATASPCCSLPSAPKDVTAALAGDGLDVSWHAPDDWGGAPQLTFEVATVPGSTTCESPALACRLEHLRYGTDYRVTVTARNAAGSSTAGTSAGSYSVPKTVPEAPMAVTAKYRDGGQAVVTWSVPASDGGSPITRYTATAAPGSKSCTASGQKRACVIAGLKGGRSYAFTVWATSALGTSAPSPVGVAGLLTSPASAPRNARLTVTGGTARVTWSPPGTWGGGTLIEYVVRAGTRSCTARRTTCSISGLALGRTYEVTITPVTTAGRGKPAVVWATTEAPRATAPKPAVPIG